MSSLSWLRADQPHEDPRGDSQPKEDKPMKLLHKALLIATAATCMATATATAKDKILASSDVGYPPFAMVGPSGAFEGYDIDVVAEISKRTGIEIEIIDQPWATTFAGLNAGKFDMVVAPVMITERRAKNLLFTQAYGDGTYQFLIRKSDPQVQGPDDLSGKVRSEEHTSELQSLMRISYAVFCL